MADPANRVIGIKQTFEKDKVNIMAPTSSSTTSQGSRALWLIVIVALVASIVLAVVLLTRQSGASVDDVKLAVTDAVNPIQVTVDDISTNQLPAVKTAADEAKTAAKAASAKVDNLAAALPQMISDTLQAQATAGAMPSMPSNPFGLTITTSTSLLTTTVGIPVQIIVKPSAVAFAGQLTGYYMWTAAGEGGVAHEPQLHSFENRDVVAGDSIVQVWKSAGTYNVDALLHTALGESAADIQITVLPDPCDLPSGTMTPAQLQKCMLQVGMNPADPAAMAQAVTTGFTDPTVYVASGITSTELPAANLPVMSLVSMSGLPTSVGEDVVDQANHDVFKTSGTFKMPDGSRITVSLPQMGQIGGEPGKLLVGAGAPQSLVDAAAGAADYFNPLNQNTLLYDLPAQWRCPEGGFCGLTWGGGTMQVGDYVINMVNDGNTTYQVYVRSHNAQVGDRNFNMLLSNYVPANVELVQYPGVPAGGFVSLGQMLQRANAAHTKDGNCGNPPNGGCPRVVMVLLDSNTGAMDVLEQTVVNGPWTLDYSNWQ